MADTDDALNKIFLQIVDEDAFSEAELRERMEDFAFHFRDCMDELPEFVECVTSVAEMDIEQSRKCFYGFFIHALNHLEAARATVMPDHENPFLSVQPKLK